MEPEIASVTEAEPTEPALPTYAPHSEVIAWSHDAILFSSCNEASACELRAFGDLAHKRVVCITAGGGRVLNLLMARPEEIWAVDLNPAQNCLLELKVAGMRALDHAGYLRFLGVRDDAERLTTYAGLRAQLSEGARQYFDRRPQLVRDGVLYQGKLERYLRKIARVLQVVRPLGIQQLFAFEDINKQREFLRLFDTPFFRVIAETACRRGMLRTFSGDPGFYKYVPEEIALHRVIYGGILDHFRECLARDNPLMQLAFFGRVIHEHSLPFYLHAATYETVKDALSRVKLITRTCTMNDALAELGPHTVDAFSVSDISSYLDDTAHAQLFSDVLVAARRGAKLVSRSNIHHRPLLPEHERRLRRDRALERELSIADHSCVHKFVIGEVL